MPSCYLPLQHHQLSLPVHIKAQCLFLPRRSILKIHLLHPLCRLSPHRLRTSRTWSPRFPPGSPPSPQSNRWNQIPHSCQILLSWTRGILTSTERKTPSQRCSKGSKPSSFHTYTHTRRDLRRPIVHVQPHANTDGERRYWSGNSCWVFGHSSRANHLPYSWHIPSLSLSLSASLSRLLLGNCSAEPSHSRDIKRSVSVLTRHTRLS